MSEKVGIGTLYCACSTGSTVWKLQKFTLASFPPKYYEINTLNTKLALCAVFTKLFSSEG